MDQILSATMAWLWPVLLLAVIAAVAGAVLRRPEVKGWLGERKVQQLIRRKLDPYRYVDMHGVYLPVGAGEGAGITQIDHVLISPYGVFVLETKHMGGWIYGSEHQKEWTQKLNPKHKVKFQNPLRQNHLHVRAVREALQLPKAHVHSVVAFMGKSSFQTDMPPEVTQGEDFITYIETFQDEIWGPEAMQDVIDRLEKVRLPNTSATAKAHLAHIQTQHASKDPNGSTADEVGGGDTEEPPQPQRSRLRKPRKPLVPKKVTSKSVSTQEMEAVSVDGSAPPTSAAAPSPAPAQMVLPHRESVKEMPQPVKSAAVDVTPVGATAVHAAPPESPVPLLDTGTTDAEPNPFAPQSLEDMAQPWPEISTPSRMARSGASKAAKPAALAPAAGASTSTSPSTAEGAVPKVKVRRPPKLCPQCHEEMRKMRLQRGPLAGQVVYRCSNTVACGYIQPQPAAST